MTEQDKQRIDRSAELYSDRVVVQHIYIDGATFEHQRMAELLKEERNKAIDECIAEMKRFCIALYSNGFMATPEEISRSLESLKSD